MNSVETLEQILRLHAKQYPRMEPQDAVKLIYQNVFGGGHLIRDPEACMERLEQEYAAIPQKPDAPLLEDIGNGMVRVMLNALDASGYDTHRLGEAFLCSAREHRGSLEEFLQKLQLLRQVTDAGAFGFSGEELDAYLQEYKAAGYPMVSHSGQYRCAYGPAYRIVMGCFLPEEIRGSNVPD